jgi:multisubunit Na+/H+ antiporter MnhB subunit
MSAAWFDVLLAVLLPSLAWYVLAVRDLFKAVVLFIVFGILLALVWVRLQAPDVALAEAAIGAGLTGALFLSALGRLQSTPQSKSETPQPEGVTVLSASFFARYGSMFACFAVGVTLSWAVFALSRQTTGLVEKVQAHLAQSGVTNPVTAVLLNFRGYDTLLEIGVLLLAVGGVWSLSQGPIPHSPATMRTTSPVFHVFVQLLAPFMLLVGGYLLWAGAHAPGGAFQGGAVIGAMAVVLLLAGRSLTPSASTWSLRVLLVVGFVCFLTVAVSVMGVGNRFLEYPQAWAGGLILLIETTLTLSIAAILASLFAKTFSAPSAAERNASLPEVQP